MVARMARGFASLEFPSTYTMLRDSLLPVRHARVVVRHAAPVQSRGASAAATGYDAGSAVTYSPLALLCNSRSRVTIHQVPRERDGRPAVTEQRATDGHRWEKQRAESSSATLAVTRGQSTGSYDLPSGSVSNSPPSSSSGSLLMEAMTSCTSSTLPSSKMLYS